MSVNKNNRKRNKILDQVDLLIRKKSRHMMAKFHDLN
jgi:hypothetical protein